MNKQQTKIFINAVESCTEWLGKLSAICILLAVILMMLVVVLRYGFDLGSVALQELIIYLHAFAFLIGAGYTLKYNDHVRVDVFYTKFSPKIQLIVDIVGYWLLTVPVCLFLFFVCWQFVIDSWVIWEGSADAGGLPFLYVLKSFLPLFVITFVLQGLAQSLKNISQLISIYASKEL